MTERKNRMTKAFITDCFPCLKSLLSLIVLYNLCAGSVYSQTPYLKRSISLVPEVKAPISSEYAHYKPLFGQFDSDSAIVESAERFGFLIIDPGGTSNKLSYTIEEHALFVVGGTGILSYENDQIPVSKNDFMYIPAGVEFSLSNPREEPLEIIIAGFKFFEGTAVNPTEGLMIANAEDVPLQVLGQHGPTTQFRLLMGTTRSTRDRLASAYQISSLFIMEFETGGTNIPHRHPREEEIYYLLEGFGEMVAGETEEGKEVRYPAKAGDAFFFNNNTLIGFYTGTTELEGRSKILAIRYLKSPPRAARASESQ